MAATRLELQDTKEEIWGAVSGVWRNGRGEQRREERKAMIWTAKHTQPAGCNVYARGFR